MTGGELQTDRPNGAAPSERRRDDRLRVIPPETDSRLRIADGWRPIRAIILDVSAGGLQVLAAEPLAFGDLLDFGFRLPDRGQPVRATIEVLRVEHLPGPVPLWQAGGRVHELDPAIRSQLAAFVAQQRRASERADAAS